VSPHLSDAEPERWPVVEPESVVEPAAVSVSDVEEEPVSLFLVVPAPVVEAVEEESVLPVIEAELENEPEFEPAAVGLAYSVVV
jgi:hypothetical protein